MATPSKNRRANIILTGLSSSYQARKSAAEVNEVPPSSISKVSESIKKARGSSFSATEMSQQTYEGILRAHEQTPTRRPSKASSRPLGPSIGSEKHDEFMVPSSGRSDREPPNVVVGSSISRLLSSYYPNIQKTPSKARLPCRSGEHEEIVQVTPNKIFLNTVELTAENATASVPSSDQPEQSIYAKLGWDDDIDDLA